jgi:hypothetical protein
MQVYKLANFLGIFNKILKSFKPPLYHHSHITKLRDGTGFNRAKA